MSGPGTKMRLALIRVAEADSLAAAHEAALSVVHDVDAEDAIVLDAAADAVGTTDALRVLDPSTALDGAIQFTDSLGTNILLSVYEQRHLLSLLLMLAVQRRKDQPHE